jgi:hypothetical protein
MGHARKDLHFGTKNARDRRTEDGPIGRSPEDLKPKSRAWEARRMRRNRAMGFAIASALWTSVMRAPAAHADPPPALRVVGQDADCPTAKQVATVLERMLPRTKITADTGPPGAAEATVADQGARFRVTVAGQERSFDDGGRQCTERARHAAVFVALVVDPPAISDPASEPPATPAPAVPSSAVDTARSPGDRRPRAMQWDLALGAVMLVAPESAGRRTAVAQGVAGFVRGKRGFHFALGAGVLHGALRYDVATADAWWIPLDVAAGFTTRTTLWEIGAEVGPSASILFILGENLRQAQREVRVEVGGRMAAWSRLWLSRQFATFLSAETVVRPFPYVLDIDPRGSVGQMPSVWLGASAGVSAALD